MAAIAIRNCADIWNTEVRKEKTRITGKMTTELSRGSKWSGGRCAQVIPFLIVNMTFKSIIVDLVIFLKWHLKNKNSKCHCIDIF